MKAINAKLSFTFDSLKEIAGTPWFGDVVLRSIEDQKAMLLEQMEKENDLGLSKIKENYQVELLRVKRNKKRILIYCVKMLKMFYVNFLNKKIL